VDGEQAAVSQQKQKAMKKETGADCGAISWLVSNHRNRTPRVRAEAGDSSFVFQINIVSCAPNPYAVLLG
jgi:hypothetical protein